MCVRNAGGNLLAAVPIRGQIKVTKRDRWYFDQRIKAVHHRTCVAFNILRPTQWCTVASATWICHISTPAGIGGSHQHKLVPIAAVRCCSGHHHISILERLAQTFQDLAGKFSKSIHEQHTINVPNLFRRAWRLARRPRPQFLRLCDAWGETVAGGKLPSLTALEIESIIKVAKACAGVKGGKRP